MKPVTDVKNPSDFSSFRRISIYCRPTLDVLKECIAYALFKDDPAKIKSSFKVMPDLVSTRPILSRCMQIIEDMYNKEWTPDQQHEIVELDLVQLADWIDKHWLGKRK